VVADDLLVMRSGAIVESGPVSLVLDAPQHAYTRQLLAAAEKTMLAPRSHAGMTDG
jgi:ABC-type microcin C transport system duplicated ATPase subunit YejF